MRAENKTQGKSFETLFGSVTFEIKEGQLVETISRLDKSYDLTTNDPTTGDLTKRCIKQHILRNSNGLFDVVRATLSSTADKLWNTAKSNPEKRNRRNFTDSEYIDYIGMLSTRIATFNKDVLTELRKRCEAIKDPNNRFDITEFQTKYNQVIESLTSDFAQDIYQSCKNQLFKKNASDADIKGMLKNDLLAAKQHRVQVVYDDHTEIIDPAKHDNKAWSKLKKHGGFSPITTTTATNGTVHFRMPTAMSTAEFECLHKQLISKAKAVKGQDTTKDSYSLYCDRLTSIQNGINLCDLKDLSKDKQAKRLRSELSSIHECHRASCVSDHHSFTQSDCNTFFNENRKRLPIYFRSLNVNRWGQDLSYPIDQLTYLAQIHNNLSTLNLLHDMNEGCTEIAHRNQHAHLAYSKVILAHEDAHKIPIETLKKLAQELTKLREQAANIAITQRKPNETDAQAAEAQDNQENPLENSLKLMLYRQLTQKNNAYLSKKNIWLTAALSPIFMKCYASGCKSAMDRYNIVRSYTQFLELLSQLSGDEIANHDARTQIGECIQALTHFINESNNASPHEAKLNRLAEEFLKKTSRCVKLITGCDSYADHYDGTSARKLQESRGPSPWWNTNHSAPVGALSVKNSIRTMTTANAQCKEATSQARKGKGDATAYISSGDRESLTHSLLPEGAGRSDDDEASPNERLIARSPIEAPQMEAALRSLNAALIGHPEQRQNISASNSRRSTTLPRSHDVSYTLWQLVPLYAPLAWLRTRTSMNKTALAYYHFIIANSLYAIHSHATSVPTIIFGSAVGSAESSNAIHLSHMLHLTHGHAHAALITCAFPAVMIAGGILAVAAGCYCEKQVSTAFQSGYKGKAFFWSIGAGVSFSAFALSICAMTVSLAAVSAATPFLWPVALAGILVAAGVYCDNHQKTTAIKSQISCLLTQLNCTDEDKKIIMKSLTISQETVSRLKGLIDLNNDSEDEAIDAIVDEIIPPTSNATTCNGDLSMTDDQRANDEANIKLKAAVQMYMNSRPLNIHPIQQGGLLLFTNTGEAMSASPESSSSKSERLTDVQYHSKFLPGM